MAGLITATINSMTKETPVGPVLQAATAATEGYISATDISFAYVAGACTIDKAAVGFTAANFVASDDEMLLVESTSGVNDGLYTIASDADQQIVLGATDVLTTETAAAAGTVKLTCVAVYKIKPTRRTGQLLIIYSEGVEAVGEIGMIPCMLNGDYWAAKNAHYKAFTATAVTDTTYYLWVETAPYLDDDGYMYFMLKPIATSTQLYTDHRPAVSVLELP